MRRLLAAEEVAGYAAFLASDRAAGVTGQAVVIDGGYTAQ
jgi:3-hydroxybutyrate dehydrogenase